ncbi:MAG: hypothetical protein RMJ33_02570 [Saprospiraceae bacterium]|nr:hypothetical protein [Saprospiraceae bacterium]MDW8228700.1 hypothetical protein [Saprospiraceae bacterium]
MNVNALGWLPVLLLWSCALWAQEGANASEEYVLIRTTDGRQYMGRLVRADLSVVVLETQRFSELVIPRSAVRRMKYISPRQLQPDFLLEGAPVAGTYFANTSAYGVPAGSGYYSTTLLLHHQVAIGLSDYVSVRGNTFLDFNYSPMWIAPKISFPVIEDVVQVALEGSLGRGFEEYFSDQKRSDISFLQGLVTLGKRSTHLTFGSGFSWSGGQWGRGPYFSISSSVGVGKRWALISESYFFRVYRRNERFDIAGIRYHSHKICLTLGLLSARQENVHFTTIIPWAGAALNFY